MGDTAIYHPGTDATVAVPEESVPHYRQAGWLTRAEWDELQAHSARTAAKLEADAKAARMTSAAGKPVSGEAKKE